MKEKDKRPIYEPPWARDLSGSSVSVHGIRPLGICGPTGNTPYESCSTGPGFTTGACYPNGLQPEQPSCSGGSSALVGCLAGGVAGGS